VINFFIGALFGVIAVLALWITDLITTNAALWRAIKQLRARIAELEAPTDYLAKESE